MSISLIIGIAVNKGKPNAWIVVRQLIYLLETKKIKVFIETKVALQIERPDIALNLSQFPQFINILFVLGGDGTLLGIARQFAPYKIPILGFNLGHLGFLTEAEPDKLEEVINKLLCNNFIIEERMMLETKIISDGKELTYHALNDVGIAKGSFGRMITSKIYISNNVYLGTYSGDGIIISTPTGSTAYSLAAGGPIVVPTMNVIIITPIAPHSLTSRPLVLPENEEIKISISATHNDFGLTIDGQIGHKLKFDDLVIIRKSSYTTKLIKLQEKSFFDIIRNKFIGER